jgi:hypothetical protein
VPKTPKRRKTQQTQVDKFLASIDREDADAVVQLCSFNTNVSKILIRLRSLGFQGSDQTVYNWYKQAFPEGTVAKRVNAEVAQYGRIDLVGLLNKHAVRANNLLDKFDAQLSAERPNIRDDQAAQLIPQLMRELRSLVSAANEFQHIENTKELGIAYADRLAREIELNFLDTPHQDIVKDAIRVAWQRLSEEEGW